MNVSCDFDGYLVCQIPENTVKVELKIKTTRVKYTLIKDAYIRTKRYLPRDRANRRAKVQTIKRRTPRREAVSKDTTVDNSTSSETDILNGEGFGYAPEIYMDPKFVASLPQIETKFSESEVAQKTFIREYCATCVKKHNRCWCNGSDWVIDLMEVEQPDSPLINLTDTTNLTKRPNSSKPVTIRQPPPGWSEFRISATNKCNIVKMDNGHRTNKSTMDEIPIDKLIIKGLRSISTEEFENM